MHVVLDIRPTVVPTTASINLQAEFAGNTKQHSCTIGSRTAVCQGSATGTDVSSRQHPSWAGRHLRDSCQPGQARWSLQTHLQLKSYAAQGVVALSVRTVVIQCPVSLHDSTYFHHETLSLAKACSQLVWLRIICSAGTSCFLQDSTVDQ